MHSWIDCSGSSWVSPVRRLRVRPDRLTAVHEKQMPIRQPNSGCRPAASAWSSRLAPVFSAVTPLRVKDTTPSAGPEAAGGSIRNRSVCICSPNPSASSISSTAAESMSGPHTNTSDSGPNHGATASRCARRNRPSTEVSTTRTVTLSCARSIARNSPGTGTSSSVRV